jgi:SPP1 gp7 family putative phage head morphogenesis protein
MMVKRIRTTPRKPIDASGGVGGILRPNASIAADFAKPVRVMLEAMAKDIKRQLLAVFEETGVGQAMDVADGAIRSRTILSQLQEKWAPRFSEMSKDVVSRMIARTVKNSAVTLGMSLREISEDFKVDTSFLDDRLKQVISASTQEATNLIKLIPQQYLADVQGAVMRSITTGRGQRDLVPFLNHHYEGRIKWVRHVAMDQTRKTYSAVTATRLQKLGCKSFIWIHTGGGAHPRKDHIAMSGKEFRYDDPPVIAVMAGQEVRGLPGQAIFCRCVQKPVFNWGNTDAA